MRPFVTPKKLTDSNHTEEKENYNYEISLLVIAKKVGLSFDELNYFTLDEFYDFVDIYIGDEEDRPRQASQNDIDNFYSYM